MSFGLFSRALIGATTAGLMVVSGAGAVSADEGTGNPLQVTPLYDTHFNTPVPGARAALIETGNGAFVAVHATGLVAPTATVTVFVYDNPAACSGAFAMPAVGIKCGGPDPASGLCSLAPFDSCNPATGFHVLPVPSQRVNRAGTSNFIIPLGSLPVGAEVQVYVGFLPPYGVDSKGKPKSAKENGNFHITVASTPAEGDNQD